METGHITLERLVCMVSAHQGVMVGVTQVKIQCGTFNTMLFQKEVVGHCTESNTFFYRATYTLKRCTVICSDAVDCGQNLSCSADPAKVPKNLSFFKRATKFDILCSIAAMSLYTLKAKSIDSTCLF